MSIKYLLTILFITTSVVFLFGSTTVKAEEKWTDCVWKTYYGLDIKCENGRISAPFNQCDANKTPNETGNRTFGCCCMRGSFAPPVLPKFILPDIQIKIPGLTFTPTDQIVTSINEEGGYGVSVPWIAEYIKAIYNYGLGIVGILAALVLMGGGVLWLISGGDASKITQAKEMIIGSITGLIILTGSYLLLFQVNPELTKLKKIELNSIPRDTFEIPVDDQGIAPSSAESSHGVPWYFQCSEEGKAISYGDCDPLKSICQSGCGVASTMMAINKLGGNAGLTRLAEKVVESGGRTCGQGSNVAGLIKAAATYNLKGVQLSSLSEVEAKLNDGHAVVMSVSGRNGSCPFTNGGHYIVLTGWHNKNLKLADVNDPNNAKKLESKKTISLEDLDGCQFTSAFYLYK